MTDIDSALPYSPSGTYAIVLAGVRDAYRVKPGTVARIDLGERHKWETYTEAVSLFWLSEGTSADIDRARTYLAAEVAKGGPLPDSRGWGVYVYPTEHPDPIGAAKLAAMEANAPPPAPPVPEYVSKPSRGSHRSRSKRPERPSWERADRR